MTTERIKERIRLFSNPAYFTVRPGYFSPSSLADYLDISRRTLDRWHSLRFGPPRIKIGKLVLFRQSAVERWLEEHESQPLRAANDN